MPNNCLLLLSFSDKSSLEATLRLLLLPPPVAYFSWKAIALSVYPLAITALTPSIAPWT